MGILKVIVKAGCDGGEGDGDGHYETKTYHSIKWTSKKSLVHKYICIYHN